jgi:glycosyltransferase involved in cell wall biosynthesis
MNVGLVVYGDLNTVSGGYLYDRKLVEHLRSRGDSVEIFSQPPRSYVGNVLENVSSSLADSILDSNLDVLLQDELNHASLIAINRQLERSSTFPVISIVHHLRSSEYLSWWHREFVRRIERRYLQSVDGYIFNSVTTRAVVQSVAGRSEPSIVAPPAGDRFTADVSEAEIRERTERNRPLQVIFLGNVIRRKGLHTLLTALASIPHSHWELSVIGRMDTDESYVQEIRQQIDRAGLRENVTMYGRLPDREIARLLRGGDVLAIPSSYEGFGIAYLEGMCFGLPAIGTTSGAASEIITHEVDGWLIEPDDAGALRQILMRVRDDQELRTLMSLNARKRFVSHPGWDESMGRIRTFLVQLLEVA